MIAATSGVDALVPSTAVQPSSSASYAEMPPPKAEGLNCAAAETSTDARIVQLPNENPDAVCQVGRANS
jgi:hypothetical protein